MKRILLKLSGEILTTSPINSTLSGSDLIVHIAKQIKELAPTHQFSIVLGGGNFFRGASDYTTYNISQATAHHVGMLATLSNGLIIQEKLRYAGVHTVLLSGIACPQIAQSITPQAIASALEKKHCIIFVGGTGSPFFTTDTTGVVRALQIEADQMWKGTKVGGIYHHDPEKIAHQTPIKTISYDDIISKQLHIMDLTAITMAKDHQMPIRVFNIFTHNALIQAAQKNDFGSRVTT